MKTRIAVCLLAIGLLVAALPAADKSKEDKSIYHCSNLIGKYVMSGTGDKAETLGNVEDIVINRNNGKIVYYVLAHGETFGLGGKYFAIAPEAMHLNSNGKNFILEGVSNKDLDNKKGFDANQWPHEANYNIGKAKRSTVGEVAKGVKKAVSGKAHLVRVNRIIGMAVRTADNKNLGSIYDLAMCVGGEKHCVAYAAVSYGSTLGVGGKLYAVPLNKMSLKSPKLRPTERVFEINTTPEKLKSLDGFTSGQSWPTHPDEKFWSKISSVESKEKSRN